MKHKVGQDVRITQSPGKCHRFTPNEVVEIVDVYNHYDHPSMGRYRCASRSFIDVPQNLPQTWYVYEDECELVKSIKLKVVWSAITERETLNTLDNTLCKTCGHQNEKLREVHTLKFNMVIDLSSSDVKNAIIIKAVIKAIDSIVL